MPPSEKLLGIPRCSLGWSHMPRGRYLAVSLSSTHEASAGSCSCVLRSQVCWSWDHMLRWSFRRRAAQAEQHLKEPRLCSHAAWLCL